VPTPRVTLPAMTLPRSPGEGDVSRLPLIARREFDRAIALMGRGSPLVPRLPRKPVAQRWRREKSSLVDVRHVNIAQTERLGDVTKPV
jgi:hypothetical protein